MPERFKVVCIPCKALYKCSALSLYNRVVAVYLTTQTDRQTNITQWWYSNRPDLTDDAVFISDEEKSCGYVRQITRQV